MSRVAARRPFLNLRLGVVALACASALLASCGGGDRKSYFTPDNIVSFGDENSALVADSASTLLDNTFPGVTSTERLPGLSFTAKPVSVAGPVVCTHDNTAAKICVSDSGVAFTAASTTYRLLTLFGAKVAVKFEVDAGATNQRTTAVDYACNAPSTWVQIVARAYGKGFSSQCGQESYGGAVSHAALGAKTADVINQINAHSGEIGSKTIVTIMVGQNDILEQYAAIQGSTQTEAGAIAVLQSRAADMAAAIKGIIGRGGKVVLALTPDLGQTPLATGAGTNALLTTLVRTYNDRLYITGLGNVSGRNLAGINPESLTKPGTRSTSYQYDTPLCDAAAVLRPDGTTPANDDEKLLYCTSQHYTSGTTANTAIWADAKRAAPLLHNLIGVTVFNRGHEQF